MSTNVYAAPRSPLEINTKPCGECGASINKKAEICPKCGVRQRNRVSKAALLLLTFFFGGIGMHKFYLRKHWWGVLYLVFFWTLIPRLVSLIEFVVYAFTGEESLNEKYDAGSGSALIVALVGVFVGVATIGIMAAVALPAYQQYSMRSRSAQALQAVEPLRMEVQGYIVKYGRLPEMPEVVTRQPVRTLANAGVAELEENGRITIRFAMKDGAGNPFTMELQPVIRGTQLMWLCGGGTLPSRLRPPQCRAQPGSAPDSAAAG